MLLNPVLARLGRVRLSALAWLLASVPAWATVSIPPAKVQPPTAVQFNPSFLGQPAGSQQIDIARFERSNSAVPGMYPVDIYINQVWFGRREVAMQAGPDGLVAPCVTRAQLQQFGVDMPTLPAGRAASLSAACHALGDWVPDAQASFDESALRLDLSLPQSFMHQQARGYVDPQDWTDGAPLIGFWSYSGNLYHTSGNGTNSRQFFLGSHAGLNWGDWHLRYNGSVTQQSGQPGGDNKVHVQGLSSYAQRDITALKAQLLLGDAYSSGDMFNGLSFRGAELYSDDRMQPDSRQGFAPLVRGVAQSNAKVTIRQNGHVVYETTVPPGPFKITDLYNTGYAGDLAVTVTETDGHSQQFVVPYTAIPQLLRPGAGRFNLLAGKLRDDSLRAPPNFTQATYQYGLNNLMTLYAGGQWSEHYLAGLIGAAVNTQVGAVALDMTQSQARGLNPVINGSDTLSGQSWRISYSKLWQPTQTNLSVAAYRYSTAGYLQLQDYAQLKSGLNLTVLARVRSQLQLNIDQPLSDTLGRVFISGSSQNYWNQNSSDTSYQAGYTNGFNWGSLTLTAGRSHNSAGVASNQYQLSLMIPLDSSSRTMLTGSVAQDDRQNSTSQLALSGSSQNLSYNGYANQSHGSLGSGAAPQSESSAGGASASYMSTAAQLSASVGVSGSSQQSSVGATGALVFHPGGVTPSQNLGESFAVIEAPGATGARVSKQSDVAVDRTGYAVVPSLIPYRENEVALDPRGMSGDADLQTSSLEVAPRSGAIPMLKFATVTGQPVLLHLKLANGQTPPVGATVYDAHGQAVTMVGQGALVFVRGQAGQALKVEWGNGPDNRCQVLYALPPAPVGKRAYPRLEVPCVPLTNSAQQGLGLKKGMK